MAWPALLWAGEVVVPMVRQKESEVNDMQEHGGDIYTNDGLFDFSANINPLGPGEKVMKALQESILKVTAYPDPLCRKLRESAAKRESVPPDYIVCGNGAADLIYTLVLAEKPKQALLCTPSFSEYEKALRTAGCKIRFHKKREEDHFTLTSRYLEELTGDLDLVFLCSPDNPTGQCIDEILLREIIERCEKNGIRLVLDECFFDFTEDAPWIHHEFFVKDHRMLFLLRAFTKMFSIPGVRSGYGVCSDTALLDRMKEARQPWPVSIPAQEAGVAALKDDLLPAATRLLIAEERRHLMEEFGRLGIRYYPADANYILFYSEIDWYEEMKQEGFLIRDCCNYRGLGKGYYRIAVKGREDNERLLAAFRRILKRYKGEGTWQSRL